MTGTTDLKPFLKRACELGATDAKLIDPASVVTAPWVRLKCRYGCGCYGSSLCCPPHSPTPEQTRAVLDCYQRAILLHCRPGVNVKELAVALERELFLAGYYKSFGYGEGPCRLCEECNLVRCTHSRQARPAMEASGIDVYATARANGLPIEVVTGRDCEQNYYGLVLAD
jgi:predicted metal-binding protein